MKWISYFLLSTFVFSTSCKSSYYVTEVSESSLALDTNYHTLDSNIAQLILPYQLSLEEKMNTIVGETAQEFIKQKPESTLGNLLADATLEISKKYFSSKPDIAIINYGGIRLPNLPQGEITLGQIYELMPFDNYLVLLKINGTKLQEVFDLMAAKGGWPIAGANYSISNGKALNIYINNQVLKDDYIYSIVLSDYLANGGDDLEILKNIPQQNKNILLRDVFIEYFKTSITSGKALESKLDNRIINE